MQTFQLNVAVKLMHS